MPRLAPASKQERRQALIDAAWRCAATRGFQSLTVDDVCAEAGVSKGAFYVYFGQKRDLLLALLEDDAAAVDAMMDDVRRSHEGGVERLRRFARAMLERGDDPSRLQVRGDLWAEMASDAGVRERFADLVRRRRAELKRWIDESIAGGEIHEMPANALASIVLALGDGLMLHGGLDPSGFRWANVRRAVDALLDGIAS